MPRKKRDIYYGYIYKCTFPDKTFYVGQRKHDDPHHDNYIGSGGNAFQETLKKFEGEIIKKIILEIIVFDPIKLNILEAKYIQKFDATNRSVGGLNTLPGPSKGGGVLVINPFNIPEIQEKIQIKNREFYKTERGLERRQEISDKKKEFEYDDSFKEKIKNSWIIRKQNGQGNYKQITDGRRIKILYPGEEIPEGYKIATKYCIAWQFRYKNVLNKNLKKIKLDL